MRAYFSGWTLGLGALVAVACGGEEFAATGTGGASSGGATTGGTGGSATGGVGGAVSGPARRRARARGRVFYG